MENHVKKKLFGNNCDNMTDNPILSALFCLSDGLLGNPTQKQKKDGN